MLMLTSQLPSGCSVYQQDMTKQLYMWDSPGLNIISEIILTFDKSQITNT